METIHSPETLVITQDCTASTQKTTIDFFAVRTSNVIIMDNYSKLLIIRANEGEKMHE
jgi:hypothetical protein